MEKDTLASTSGSYWVDNMARGDVDGCSLKFKAVPSGAAAANHLPQLTSCLLSLDP